MLTDAHCHLDFYENPDAAIQSARNAGVEIMVTVGYTMASCEKAAQLAGNFPVVYAGVGLHPWEAAPIDEATHRRLRELAHHPKVVCISEIGLDYTRNPETKEIQREILRQQVRLAREMNLPLNTHNDRPSEEDMVKIFQEERAGAVGGIIHGFRGDLEYAKKCLEMGFCLSFGRMLLRPEGEYLQELVRWAPRDRLVIETDSAGAAGSSPADVALVAEKLGQLLNLSLEETTNLTAANLKRALKI